MPLRAWVVTRPDRPRFSSGNVSMPSRAWVVTISQRQRCRMETRFNALTGLSCYKFRSDISKFWTVVSMTSRAWVVTAKPLKDVQKGTVSMTSRAWVVTIWCIHLYPCNRSFNDLTGLSCYWVSTRLSYTHLCFNDLTGLSCYAYLQNWIGALEEFQWPHGLELLRQECPIF